MDILGALQPFISIRGPNPVAAQNVAEIQAGLDEAASQGGGTVAITVPGEYLTNRPLVIGSRTTLVLGSGVSIKQAPGANTVMLVNRALNAPTSNVTLTWSSGTALQVNWTNHGLIVGDFISIANVTPVAFAGVYRVETVPSANTLTVVMHRNPAFGIRVSVTNGSSAVTLQQAVPFSLAGYSLVTNDAATIYTVSAHAAGTSAVTLTGNYTGTTSTNFRRRATCTLSPVGTTGSIQAKKCDVEINLIGGDWNYNQVGGNTGGVAQSISKHAIVLGYVAGLEVADVNAQDAPKYLLNVGACAHVRVKNFHSQNHVSEVFKVYGPAFDVQVDGIRGNGLDDIHTYQTKEPDAFAAYRFTFGDILNCKTKNVYAEHSGGTGAVVAYGSNEEFIDDLTFENVIGYSPASNANVAVTPGTGLLARIGKITIDGVHGRVGGASAGTVAAVRLWGSMSGEAEYIVRNIDCACLNGVVFMSAVQGQSALVERCGFRDNGTYGAPVTFNGCILRKIVCSENNFDQLTPTTIGYAFTFVGGDMPDVHLLKNYAPSDQFFAALDGLHRDIVIENNDATNASDHFVRLNSSTGTPSVRLINNQTNTLVGCQASVSCDLFFSGNRFSAVSLGAVRTGGNPTVVVRSAGNNQITGPWIVVPSGTPVLTVFGWDIAIDPLTLTGLATTAGQFGTSTQVAPDNGPFVRTAVGWVALGTGAAGVNTIIT